MQPAVQEVGFFPDWGRDWPLWGVGRNGLPGISDDLAGRLRAWCRVWQEELDPVFDVRWKDPQKGRAWHLEGHELVREVQSATQGRGVKIVPDFEMYGPDA